MFKAAGMTAGPETDIASSFQGLLRPVHTDHKLHARGCPWLLWVTAATHQKTLYTGSMHPDYRLDGHNTC